MTSIAIAQELIRIDSDTAHSNVACSDALHSMLEQRGFESERYDYHDMRGCPKVTLAARRLGKSGQTRGIAFFSHSDVVSSDGWHAPLDCGPTDALVHEGRIWGRGACDMKGPIASALSAIDSIQPSDQNHAIYFFVTGDEECGMVGAQLLTQTCPWYQEVVASNSAGVITEPTSLRVVHRHKGACRFRVSAHGIAAHSSTTQGVSANWQLIPWLDYIASMRHQMDTDRDLRNEDFDPPTLNLNAVLHNTPSEFNITVSHAWCELFLRTMPETRWQRWVDDVTKRARELELEVSAILSLPPLDTSPDSPLVHQALSAAGRDRPDTAGYATDGCRYSDLKNLIVLGPGSIDQAHRADEWIDIQELSKGASVYRSLIERIVC